MKKMLLRQLIILPLLLAMLVLLAMLHAYNPASGMGSVTAEVPVRFSNTYVFKVGSSVAIPSAAGPAISAAAPNIKLERVNDSRCRVGAVCVWAGYISYSFTLTNADGSASNFVLSDNMPGAASHITQNGLTFTLSGVEPKAVPAKNEATPDYRVSLRVSNTE